MTFLIGYDMFKWYKPENKVRFEMFGWIYEKNTIKLKEKSILKSHIILNNTLSVGYSIFPENGSSIEELIQNADRHMYNMKEKNHREIYLKHRIKHNKMNYAKKND